MIIYEFEEHSEVLAFWKKRNILNSNLLCFDQHFDLKKIESQKIERLIDIDSNSLKKLLKDVPFRDNDDFCYGIDDFLYVATELNIFKHIVWVYPIMQGQSSICLNTIFIENLSLIAQHGDEIIQNYQKEIYGYSTTVNGIKFSITTLEEIDNLLSIEPDSFYVDVDLDYFYSDQTDDIIISLDDFVEKIRQQDNIYPEITFTYSISSGYLNPKYRYIGKYIADKLNASVHYISYIHKSNYPFFESVVRPTISSNELVNKILESNFCKDYGGAAYSVLSNLYLILGNIQKSEEYYHNAINNNDYATFPAYKIANYYMSKKKYLDAYKWYGNTQVRLTDTLQIRALYMQAIAAFRLGRLEDCLRLSYLCIELVPLREEPFLLISLIGDKTGNDGLQKDAHNGLINIKKIKDLNYL